MKIEKVARLGGFKPFEVALVFESEAEVKAWKSLVGRTNEMDTPNSSKLYDILREALQ